MKTIEWLEGFTQAMVGWRKFTIAVVTILAAWDLCRMGNLEGSGFVTTALGVLGLFGLANVAAKKVIADSCVDEGVVRS